MHVPLLLPYMMDMDAFRLVNACIYVLRRMEIGHVFLWNFNIL